MLPTYEKEQVRHGGLVVAPTRQVDPTSVRCERGAINPAEAFRQQTAVVLEVRVADPVECIAEILEVGLRHDEQSTCDQRFEGRDQVEPAREMLNTVGSSRERIPQAMGVNGKRIAAVGLTLGANLGRKERRVVGDLHDGTWLTERIVTHRPFAQAASPRLIGTQNQRGRREQRVLDHGPVVQ